MKHIWVIKVTFHNGIIPEVNFNEGYTTYEKAIKAVMAKIENEYSQDTSGYRIYDIVKEIEYELKLVDIIE